MKIFSTLFLLIISACSTHQSQKYMARIEIDEKLLGEIQKERSWGKRAPASAEKLSARRVYFRALYGQYQIFQKLAQAPNSVEHCPAFHQDFLSMNAPSQEVVSPIAARKQLAETGLEIKELCEKGVSSNYYRFENLITYHTGNEAFHTSPKSFFALLKIPVFHNMYELKMQRNILSYSPEMVEMSGTQWFLAYLDKEGRKDRFLSLRN